MPEVHAKLSPSSGERWINCTKSFELIDSLNIPESEAGLAAEEGTLAHSVLENECLHRLGRISPVEYKSERSELVQAGRDLLGYNPYNEMQEYAQQQIDVIFDLTRKQFLSHKHEGVIWLETRVFPGIEGCFGTADAIVALEDELHVIDYKYGRGVPVSPVENTQLKLYGLGALEAFKAFWNFNTVTLHIIQPRLASHRQWETLPEKLVQWREDVVKPAVEEINAGNGKFAPSEGACRWCPAKALCTARAQKIWEGISLEL